MQRDILEQLCRQGLTQRQIAERLGTSHTTVRYWLAKHELRTDGRVVAKAWDSGEFTEACATSQTVAEVLDKMGAIKYSGNYRRAAKYAQSLGVELPVARKGTWTARVLKPILSDEEVLARFRMTDVPSDNTTLKRWMTQRLGVRNECVECRIGPEWNGRPLTLELDHIDGDRLNNELSNLRLLCPNCHAQTETSNRKKYDRTAPS